METREREPESDELVVLKAMAQMLRPTILEPFKPFERPWRHEEQSAPGSNSRLEIDGLVTRVAASLQSFTVKLPQIMAFRTAGPMHSDSVSQAMALRVDGDPYKAICLLATQLDNDPSTSDSTLLHYTDTLWDLSLHGSAFIRAPSFIYDARSSDKVEIAISLAKAVERLFGGGNRNFSLEDFSAPAVLKAVLEVPHRSDEEICICRYRLLPLAHHRIPVYLSRKSRQAIPACDPQYTGSE